MTQSADWTTRFPPLAQVKPAVLQRLREHSQLAEVPAGNVVFRNGDPAERYLLVLSGSVAVTRRNRDGQEILLYRVETGQSCILTTSCLLAGEHYPAESMTESDTQAVVIPRSVFEQSLDDCSVFRAFVMTAYGERVAELITLVERLSFDRLSVRLADYLLRHEQNDALKRTHSDIARDLGSAREVISRQLKAFEHQGLIALGRGSIQILSRQGLRTEASAV